MGRQARPEHHHRHQEPRYSKLDLLPKQLRNLRLRGNAGSLGQVDASWNAASGRRRDHVRRRADADGTADQALRSVELDEGLLAWVRATHRFLSGAPLTDADDFARGTWMAPRPGQLEDITTLDDPGHINGIHFTGADLCVTAYGTIEGAIVSGRRAAARIAGTRRRR